MTELQVFDVEGADWRWGQDSDGTPWAVATDVATSFEHSNTSVMLRMLDEGEKGLRSVYTPGGQQELKVVLEDGIWELIFRSTKPNARRLKKRVKAILREIRETGRYSARPATAMSRLDLIDLAREAELERIKESARADHFEHRAGAAEGTIRQIEAGDGLPIRMFHKKYFSEIREREFFDHLYGRGYLIDQRGKGGVGSDGKPKPGPQHRHPAAKGKPYLYFHFGGIRGEKRRENTRVRPGQPELDFKTVLIRDGLPANDNGDGYLFAIEGGY